MPTYELAAYDTERRDDRHREYTRSRRTAERWERIPRIQFTDSGHGIVYVTRELQPGQGRKPRGRRSDHVERHMDRLATEERERQRRAEKLTPKEFDTLDRALDALIGSDDQDAVELPPIRRKLLALRHRIVK
jgi:hypothetical protein